MHELMNPDESTLWTKTHKLTLLITAMNVIMKISIYLVFYRSIWTQTAFVLNAQLNVKVATALVRRAHS